MDVISLVVAIRDAGFSEDPVGVVASRIARNGTVITLPSAYNPQ